MRLKGEVQKKGYVNIILNKKLNPIVPKNKKFVNSLQSWNKGQYAHIIYKQYLRLYRIFLAVLRVLLRLSEFQPYWILHHPEAAILAHTMPRI